MRYLILFLALISISSTGCVELGMYNEREDCSGKAHYKTLPAGYPCLCCPVGQQ